MRETLSPPVRPAGFFLGVLAALVAVWILLLIAFPGFFYVLGINHYRIWFLDSFAILASNDAAAIGLDPYQHNPLDYLQRPHSYSHWWLGLHSLGLTRASNLKVGLAIVALFLGTVFARLRPGSWRELFWYFLVLGSPALMLGIERANNDLIVFALLSPLVACLRAERPSASALALFLIAVAAGLKFYPAIAALMLLAGDDPARARQRFLWGGLALALVAVNIAPDLARIGSNLPRGEGLMTFGALNLLEALHLPGLLGKGVAVLAYALVVLLFQKIRVFEGWTAAPEDRSAWLSFMLGAMLLTGCFLAGPNFGYRWVFALWLAPLLWRLPRDPRAPRRLRRFASVTAALLMLMLWGDPMVSALLNAFRPSIPPVEEMAWADRFFLAEQPFTWAFFGCLLCFLSRFGRELLGALAAPARLGRAGRDEAEAKG